MFVVCEIKDLRTELFNNMRSIIIYLLIVWCQNIFAQEVVVREFKGKIAINTSKAVTSVSDIDGNVYKTVAIGNQLWMVENLKTTRYSDGTAIPLVNANPAWEALTPSCKAYCWYNDDIFNKDKFGALYTWSAAMNGVDSSNKTPSGVQGVCPSGWHLPSDEEWQILANYLIYNGHSFTNTGIGIGKSMAATIGWTTFPSAGTVGNDQKSNNSSGFSALPGGSRLYNGTFNQAGCSGNWWRSTEYSSSLAYFRYICYSNSRMYSGTNNKQNGLSVRCLRDY
jgi:uncharacterized protein (TIGR02145 family)